MVAQASSETPPDVDPVQRALDRSLPWLTHGNPFSHQLFGTGPWPEQGWKLHVSATALSAFDVLERTLPVLLISGARFKVINSTGRVAALNNGLYGATQVGKFITIYPESDRQAVQLATELEEATRGLRGPRVPSDRPLRPRSLIHYRYGAFRTRETSEKAIEAYDLLDPAGRLTRDQRQQFYVSPPPEIGDPFEAAGIVQEPPPREGALAGRYLIVDVLSRTYRGGVFKAIDLEASPPRVCLLKEFWHDVGADSYGRDARAWGENEAELLTRHPGDVDLPRCYGSFELDGNFYVVLEYIEGTSLDRDLGRGPDAGGARATSELLRIGIGSARALQRLHERGIIFRDFKPGNIIRTPDGGYRLIDFGLAWDCASGTRPLEGGTPLFVSPEQYACDTPSAAQDVFSWGAVLHLLATGRPPGTPASGGARLRPARREPLRQVQPNVPQPLAAVIDRAVAWQPPDRYPSMAALLADLQPVAANLAAPARRRRPAHAATARRTAAHQQDDDPLALARAGGDALCDAAEPRGDGLCWPTRNELRPKDFYGPDLYDGAAGVALVLAELARATGNARYGETARGAARWLMGPAWANGRAMPGLHCGEAGVGYLLVRLATLLDEPGYMKAAELRARRMAGVQLDTSDLLYGAAGAAVTLARLAVTTGERAYFDQANAMGGLLVRLAQPAPGGTGCYWEVRSTDPSVPARPYLGLAHGAAGIGYALIELFRATGNAAYLQTARATAEMLLAQAVPHSDGGWRWSRSLRDREPELQAQCHGAVGIGQFFLRLDRVAPNDRYRETAGQAAITTAGLLDTEMHSGVCHGLAGHGSFLLDCYQALGDEHYLHEAQRAGQLLAGFQVPEQPGVYRSGESGVCSPDLMLGYAGVAGFFLRLSEPARRTDIILDG